MEIYGDIGQSDASLATCADRTLSLSLTLSLTLSLAPALTLL